MVSPCKTMDLWMPIFILHLASMLCYFTSKLMKVLFCLNECNHSMRMPPHRAWEGSYHIIMNSHTVAYMDLTFIICLAAKSFPPEANTSYLIDFSAPQRKLLGTERCRTKCKKLIQWLREHQVSSNETSGQGMKGRRWLSKANKMERKLLEL